MSDRRQLEEAEARVLLCSYWHNVRIKDKAHAGRFLADKLARLEKFYGAGFSDRCKRYMRQQQDEFAGNLGDST